MANLLQHWKRVDGTTLAEGLTWYPSALQLCESMATFYKAPLDRVIDVVALCSPRASWEANRTMADRLLEAYTFGFDCPYGGPQYTLAWSVLNGAVPFRSGPKVTAFRDCIAAAGNWHVPCIDGHMTNMIEGERNRILTEAKLTPAKYRKYSAIVQQFAHKHTNLPTAQVQAVLWCHWRKEVTK